MAEYTGSRRANPLTPGSAENAFAEDDAMPTCPECGAGVRPDQQWCTLCLHVLTKPEPLRAVPAVVAVATSAMPAAPVAPVAPADPTSDTAAGTPVYGAAPNPEVEAAAEALLAQLAVESRRDRLAVPSYLDSKAKVAAACAVVMTGLTGVCLLVLTVFGAIVR